MFITKLRLFRTKYGYQICLKTFTKLKINGIITIKSGKRAKMSMLKKPYKNLTEVYSLFDSLYGGRNSDCQKERYETAFSEFKKLFDVDEAYIASSSGRVEVCGNHTDHNGGKVMSCAISLDSLAFFMPTENDEICIKSDGYSDIKFNLSDLEPRGADDPAALVRGVAKGLVLRGYKIGGFNAFTTSNVRGGAGVSSSASFEVLIAEIFNFLYNEDKIDCETKSYIAQYAENVYFEKPCGLLDQSAIAYGGLKKLDFSNENKIGVENVELFSKDFTFILINTGGSHADLTDEYAAIPREMKQVAAFFGKKRLIEVPEEDFVANVSLLADKVSDRAILRAFHFYEENKRVDVAANSLAVGDFSEFKKCIGESGVSSLWKLQNCYVSGKTEQPILRALAVASEFIKDGAVRVHGGGFAGCVLCVLKTDTVKDFLTEITKYYEEKNVLVLSVREKGTIVL